MLTNNAADRVKPPYPHACSTYEAEGHDLQSLLFNFLDELLFGFATDFFVAKELTLTAFDRQAFRISAQGCVCGCRVGHRQARWRLGWPGNRIFWSWGVACAASHAAGTLGTPPSRCACTQAGRDV